MLEITYYFIMSCISISLIAGNDRNMFIFDYWDSICYNTLDLNERLYCTLPTGSFYPWEVLGIFIYLISNFFNKSVFIEGK